MERSPSRKDADAAYVRKLGETLRQRDVSALREFLAHSAEERNDPGEAAEIRGMSDEDLEARMHKMIMARKDLPELHDESRKWLVSHGFTPLR